MGWTNYDPAVLTEDPFLILPFKTHGDQTWERNQYIREKFGSLLSQMSLAWRNLTITILLDILHERIRICSTLNWRNPPEVRADKLNQLDEPELIDTDRVNIGIFITNENAIRSRMRGSTKRSPFDEHDLQPVTDIHDRFLNNSVAIARHWARPSKSTSLSLRPSRGAVW